MTRFPQMGYTPAEPGWDLNHLLLAQMNFGGASQFVNTPTGQPQVYPNSPTTTAETPTTATSLGILDSSYSMPSDFPPKDLQLMSAFTTYNQPVAVTQDMAAMWSDAPSSFNIEEWDQFVTAFSGSNAF